MSSPSFYEFYHKFPGNANLILSVN